MKRPARVGLQTEFARLLAEYPREEWLKLAEMLRDTEFIKVLANTVGTLAAVASAASPPRQQRVRPSHYRQPKEPGGDFLSSLAQGDESKLGLLRKIKRGLDDKMIFKNMADVRSFAELASIKEQLPAKREPAIKEILRHLSRHEPRELEKMLEIRSTVRNQGQEYREWVNLILGRS
jgi:hypothetical protein